MRDIIERALAFFVLLLVLQLLFGPGFVRTLMIFALFALALAICASPKR